MKRLFSILMALCLVFALAACGGTTPPAPNPDGEEDPGTGTPGANEAFTGKIAIITNTVSQNEEEYRSAQQVVERYGDDKVIHVTWPDNFMTEQEQMVSIVSRVASDPEVRALIINQAVPGTNAAVDKLLEIRDDIYIVYCKPVENPADVAARADLVLIDDEIAMGEFMVQQAVAMGATTMVHYSFPRHMGSVLISGRYALMQKTCEELGIELVFRTAPDPTGEAGNTGAQQFILEDVPKVVEEFGTDTAFFSTNCIMQVPLITAVFEAGAYYPQPCCPSPFHGFPSALGIESGDNVDDIDYVVAETQRIVSEAGLEGHFSTWPVPVAMMNTVAGAEYAINVINGEVSRDEVDLDVLLACLKDYAGVDINVYSYSGAIVDDNGEPVVDASGNEQIATYDNFKLYVLPYLNY